jgi:hypothetical protein
MEDRPVTPQYDEDPPQVDFVRRRFVAHTRKPFVCGFCLREIAAGSRSYVTASKVDGEFAALRNCSPNAECLMYADTPSTEPF